MKDGLPEPQRAPFEPPARFPYDPYREADALAWALVCPNYYLGPEDDQAYSVLRYTVGVADGQVVAFDRDGRVADDPDPEPEDTEELLRAYLQARSDFICARRDGVNRPEARRARQAEVKTLGRASVLAGLPVCASGRPPLAELAVRSLARRGAEPGADAPQETGPRQGPSED